MKNNKNNRDKVKKNRKKNGGFTLVELLATLAILSLVSVIVMYTATNVINNAREKSYLVTINNIQNESGTYVLENDRNIIWLDDDGSNFVYQCVTVQNLIDMGYFDNNILDSKVSEDRNVKASDYIYIEKNNTTKTITKQVLLYDDNSDLKELCGDYIKGDGIIGFSIHPSNDIWSQSKDVTISYRLDDRVSIGDSDNYLYSYEYDAMNDNSKDESRKSFNFTTSRIASKKITVFDEGTVYAYINQQDDKANVVTASSDVIKIDTVGPEIYEEYNGEHTVRGRVTIPIRIVDRKNISNTGCENGDCGSGLDKSKISADDFQVSIDGKDEDIEVILSEKNCDSNGDEINYCTYNLIIKNYSLAGELKIVVNENTILDMVSNGNKETILKPGVVFDNTYKIKYNANSGSGKMSATTCTYGNDCTLRTNAFTRIGYTFLGWNTDQNATNALYNNTYLYIPNLDNEIVKDEIELYAIWNVNKVTIYYKVAGGTLENKHPTKGYSVDSNGYITDKNGRISTVIKYGEKIGDSGLYNYDYTSNFIVSKVGNIIESGKEWCLSTDCNNKVYSQANYTNYDDKSFSCDTSKSNCTVELLLKWVPKVLKVTYHANNGTTTTATQSFTYGDSGNRFGYKPDGSVYFEGTGQFGAWDRAGYTLLGWAHNSTATVQNYSPYSYVNNEFIEGYYPEVHLYAVWEVNDTTPPTCTISANNDGKLIGSCSDDSGSCAYNGWDSSYSGNNSTEKTVDSTGTVTYYVKDAVGNEGSCSVLITDMVVSSYTKTTNKCVAQAGGYTKTIKTCNESASSYTCVHPPGGPYHDSLSCSGFTSKSTCTAKSGCSWTGILKKTCSGTYLGDAYYKCPDNTTQVGNNGGCLKYKQSSCNTAQGWTIYSTNYSYSFGSSSSSTESSCSPNSFTCNKDNKGKTHVSCSAITNYIFSSSSSSATSCSRGSSFTCSASTVNNSYVSACTVAGYKCPTGYSSISGTNYCFK